MLRQIINFTAFNGTGYHNAQYKVYQKINQNNSLDNTVIGIDLADTKNLRAFLADVVKTKQYDNAVTWVATAALYKDKLMEEETADTIKDSDIKKYFNNKKYCIISIILNIILCGGFAA